MNKAWMLILILAAQDASAGAVAAVDGKTGAPIEAGALVNAGSEPRVLVDRNNVRYELGPRSVAEFAEDGELRLLRGAVLAESALERAMKTSGSQVDFVGKVLVSYDHKEKSTSAFVLEGQARMVNPHESARTLRLDRFRGATIVVGDVLPRLVRQLDFASVDAWLKGYSWSDERRAALLKELPREKWSAEPKPAEHLAEAKLEDYFSSIETADEFHQPDYYQRKFADPDQVVADANAIKGSGKAMSPEEAALISLPKTRIDVELDLPLEMLSSQDKAREVAGVDRNVGASKPARSLASVAAPKKRAQHAPRPAERGDPEINTVLERLRSLKGGSAVNFAPARGPASAPISAVPDPVYDYSENY